MCNEETETDDEGWHDMPLTCDINDEPEPGEILYRLDHAAPKPVKLNRRKRCSDSRCNAFVSNGDSIISVERFKIPESDIEIRVRGEDGEIDMSPMLLCVDCSWNLVALRDEGYACVFPFGLGKLLYSTDPPSVTVPKLAARARATSYSAAFSANRAAKIDGCSRIAIDSASAKELGNFGNAGAACRFTGSPPTTAR